MSLASSSPSFSLKLSGRTVNSLRPSFHTNLVSVMFAPRLVRLPFTVPLLTSSQLTSLHEYSAYLPPLARTTSLTRAMIFSGGVMKPVQRSRTTASLSVAVPQAPVFRMSL